MVMCRGAVTGVSRGPERNVHGLVTPLRQTLNRVFVPALRFRPLNRGTRPTVIDAATCSKRRKLDKESAILWRGPQNRE